MNKSHNDTLGVLGTIFLVILIIALILGIIALHYWIIWLYICSAVFNYGLYATTGASIYLSKLVFWGLLAVVSVFGSFRSGSYAYDKYANR